VTELGVDRIIPMTTERSVISFSVDRAAQRYQRWQRIVEEASEQSGRAMVPSIEAVASFSDVLSNFAGVHAAVLWEDEQSVALSTLLEASDPLLVMVGPEGGFTQSEIEQARVAGVQTASLGPLTLRAETAAVAGAAIALSHRISPTASQINP